MPQKARMRLPAERDQLAYRKSAGIGTVRKHHSHCQGELVRSILPHIFSQHGYRTAHRRLEPAQRLDQSRLTGTVEPYQGGQFSEVKGEIHTRVDSLPTSLAQRVAYGQILRGYC